MSAGWFDNASCPQNSSYKMMNNELHHSPITPSSKQGIAIASFLNYSDSTKLSSSSSSPSSFHNTNSIRRTLSSADMSSLHTNNNGFPHSSVKRVKSSVQLQAVDSIDHDDEDHDQNNKKGPAFEEIWSSIQADKKSWGCILSAPKNGSGSDSGQLPPPYVHPLEKRTASSLSEKSLGICTESLGSETGSDGFSCPPSDQEDSEEEQEQEKEEEAQAQQESSEVRGYNVEVGIYKYNYNYNSGSNRGPTSKRSTMVPPPVRPSSSFPPPLPSLAHRDDGSNLHIRSHRQDGRLVVQAVAVPSHNRFRAQRHDGRLLLSFSSSHQDEDTIENEQEEEEEEWGDVVENDDVQLEEEEEEFAIPREQLGVLNVNVNVQRSCAALAMTKFMELATNRNKSTWPRNYNTTVIKSLNNNNEEMEEEEEAEQDHDESGGRRPSMTQSLPPRPTMSPATAAAVAMNAYEYYWRRSNSPAVAMFKPLAGAHSNNLCAPQVGKDTARNNNKAALFAAHNRKGGAPAQHDQVVVVKAAGRRAASTGEKTECVFPLMLRGCKEPKKPSLLLWEPHCIATS